MKTLIRSRSDTELNIDKNNLDIINQNIRQIKPSHFFPKYNKQKMKNMRRTTRQKTDKLRLSSIRNSSLINIDLSESLNNLSLNDSNIKKSEEDPEKIFKTYITKILRMKIALKGRFLSQHLQVIDYEKNIYLNMILYNLQKFKNNFYSDSQSDHDSSIDSENEPEDDFLVNIKKLERIINKLIQIHPEDMFREVKSILFIEFEATTSEIQEYLHKLPNQKNYKLFLSIIQNILFIISKIALKYDYYAISINCLVENLNRFIIDLVDEVKDSSRFVKCLNVVQKFIKIKKNFMKEFVDNNPINNNLFNIYPNKFCSFGIYFFRNFFNIMSLEEPIISAPKIPKKELSPCKPKLSGFSPRDMRSPINNTFQPRYSRSLSNIVDVIFKKNYKTSKRYSLYNNPKYNNLELNKLFRVYFTSKLANWKYSSINATGEKKEEMCRICEKKFSIDNFILHLFYCKEQKYNAHAYNELKGELHSSIESLNAYKELLVKDKEKDIFFSPRSEFNQKFILHIIEKEHKNVEEVSKYSEMELLNRIIDVMNKEKNLVCDFYIKYPNKLTQLISILHFTIFIFCHNKNSSNFSSQLNTIFADLIRILMKKIILIENILTLHENKEKAMSYIKKYVQKDNLSKFVRKKTTVKELYNKIDLTTSKFKNSPVTKIIGKSDTRLFLNGLKSSDNNIVNPNIVKAVNSELRNFSSTHDVRAGLFSSLKVNDQEEDQNLQHLNNFLSKKSSGSICDNNTKHTKTYSSTLSIEDEAKYHAHKRSLFEKNNSEKGEDDSLDYTYSSPMSYLFINEHRNDSYILNLDMELDSQFDEMIELMDEMQNSDRKDFTTANDVNTNLVGKGAYGRVDLYKKITTGDIYAIKAVDINQKKSLNLSETLVLNEVYSDFVVKCYYIFSDVKYIYYVMEYHPGGDLLSLLNGYVLDDETIRLIIAEVILALEYLHSKDIIHRDIKPENIVISNDGHFKLTDFGLSNTGLSVNKYNIQNQSVEKLFVDEMNESNSKKLGTEQYMAPEIIEGEEISEAVDYWALGVLIFELYTGKLPFCAKSSVERFEKILNVNIDWKEFEGYNNSARDLIEKFLVKDQQNRWGSWNTEEIKSHSFFKEIEWKNIRSYRDPLVIQHVKKSLEKLKKQDPSQNIPIVTITDPDNICTTTDYYARRVDNLDKKNREIIRGNIRLKKVDFETNDELIDMLRDIV